MKTKAEIETAILGLLASRDPGKTICPSEAARLLWPGAWRGHMEDVRKVGIQLEAEGLIQVLQRGELVPSKSAIGPIRYRLPPTD